MKRIFAAGAVVLLALLALGAGVGHAASPPNIVLIFADDLGWGDLGCYGQTKIKTPHLDRMAREGARFSDFYAAAPVCTPSRAALLTGRYPLRSGLTRVLNQRSSGGIGDGETTLAEALRARGYATTVVGKWHLGHLPPFLPTRHGFDSYFGIPYSNDMKPAPLLRGEETIEMPAEQTTLTRRYTDEAIGFVKRSAAARKPFFLYFPHTFPHVPLFASAPFRGKSAGGLFGDVVEEMDASVGEILQTLRALKIDNNTLIVFTSDNGPWLIKGDQAGSAGPLREGKTTTYEGGMRVPCLVRWPGTIPAGRVVQTPAMTIDLFPTLLALAGAKAPANPVVDGRVLDLFGEKERGGEHPYYYFRNETLEAVRVGDWKLHLARKKPDGSERPAELYQLSSDIGEAKNVLADHPDVVKRLSDLTVRFDALVRVGAAALQR